MKCHEFLSAMHRYLDDEMSVMRRLRMYGHVILCKPCRRVMESEAALTSLLAADALDDSPPAGLRERILEQIRTESSASPDGQVWSVRSARLPAWLAAVGLVGLCFVLIILTRDTPDPVPSVVAELVAEHLRYDEDRSGTLEITTSDTSRMAEWLKQRLRFPVELPRLTEPDERLIGGHVFRIADIPAAHLLYEWRGHRISVVIAKTIPADGLGGSAQMVDGVELRTSSLEGVALAWWVEKDEGRLYAAASRGSLPTVVEFARRCVENPEKPARKKWS